VAVAAVRGFPGGAKSLSTALDDVEAAYNAAGTPRHYAYFRDLRDDPQKIADVLQRVLEDRTCGSP
jgi:hypothetical protein